LPRGTPIVRLEIDLSASGFENGSPASNPASTWSTNRASAVSSVNTVMQSIERHAGSSPCVLQRPLVGLKPMRCWNAAGTRPDPAVSVPSAKATWPVETATDEPELEPPLT
jgi:hypothetical protein